MCLASSIIKAQPGKPFELIGNISGVKEGMVMLSYASAGGTLKKDSTIIKDGLFRLTGTVSEPNLADLFLQRSNEENSVSFFLEPARMTIDLKEGQFGEAKITGSTSQAQYSALEKAKKRVDEKYKQQLDSLETERDHERRAEVRERLAPYFREYDQEEHKFFEQNLKSPVTAYRMRFHSGDLSLDSIQRYYDRFGFALQQSTDGKYVMDEIVKLRGGSPGSMAKDFTSTDVDGKPLSLSDYKGKYVLIDFWASWCVPCRKGNPHLKEVYAKYKDRGMEIIGVADDDQAEDAWKQAVAKDGIGIWKHIRRGLKYENGVFDHSTDISEKFAIQTLPTKILINPAGKIIGRYSADEAPLDKKLAEVFK